MWVRLGRFGRENWKLPKVMTMDSALAAVKAAEIVRENGCYSLAFFAELIRGGSIKGLPAFCSRPEAVCSGALNRAVSIRRAHAEFHLLERHDAGDAAVSLRGQARRAAAEAYDGLQVALGQILFSFKKRLMALPPNMSPAPVVSTTWMPLGEETVAAAFFVAAKQPLGPSVA